MTEQTPNSSTLDQKTDQLLKQVFSAPDKLPGNFENRVMSTIRAETQQSRQHKLVLIIMMAYWAIASMAGSWLLFETSALGTDKSSVGLSILLIMTAVIIAGIGLLVRQSSFKVSDLFLGTMR